MALTVYMFGDTGIHSVALTVYTLGDNSIHNLECLSNVLLYTVHAHHSVDVQGTRVSDRRDSIILHPACMCNQQHRCRWIVGGSSTCQEAMAAIYRQGDHQTGWGGW